ncbi:MAG: C-terminal target protein [Flavipsychrobacter sp.]|nr:C-terminal target protein [Flavipsychrobacter sp.]
MKLLLFILLLPACLGAQTITTVVGTGTAGFGGDGGSAATAQLHQPSAIAFDKHGNMYVIDGYSYRVRMINTTGIINTIAGTGTIGSAGDGGPATAAEIEPLSIATDSSDNIYITETKRIRKIDAAGIITTIAGTATLGYNGDGISATTAKLSAPYLGYADGTGAVIFSDKDNNRIRKVDAAGTISTIYGTGISGSDGDDGPATAARFIDPYFLYRSAAGDIYVPDPSARRTRKIDAAGIITAFAGYGAGGSGGGDGGPATNAAVASVTNAVVDDSGNVYLCLSNANRIRKVNTAGIISAAIGSGTAGYSGDGGPLLAAELNAPAHIAMYKGNLFIADKYNNCIRKVGYNVPLQATGIVNETGHTILYPNPATNEIILSSKTAITKVVIINMAGQVVAMHNYNTGWAGNRVTIVTHDLAPGLYAVWMNDVYSGRFEKNQ